LQIRLNAGLLDTGSNAGRIMSWQASHMIKVIPLCRPSPTSKYDSNLMKTYEQKVEEQIKQFRDVENLEELPDIFHYWSNKYILPLLQDILGVNGVTDFYFKYFSKSLDETKNNTILSIGCGDCFFETEIAVKLRDAGYKFNFECLDLAEGLINRAEEKINQAGISDFFSLQIQDINNWQPSATYAGIMAHQSLHHVVELESLFKNIKSSLHPKGLFLSNETIGKNGHQRWPEALEIINKIWAFAPDKIKYNRSWNNRFESSYINHDCSSEGFEGIRAQDILPLMVREFHFDKFIAFGNIPDIFVDRCFGHNFDPNDERDKAFIDFLEYLNQILIDLGYIKPTMMFAVMRKAGKTATHCHKHCTPDFCVRETEQPEPPAETDILPEKSFSSFIQGIFGRKR